ncbi:lysine N(6)-hydroxylase/L-ornithine N(5)-oxygenase family protein [Paenibacillus lutrae]|uniref:L-lysine N6-monooxygenase MbtG n=1 Tax=Paenibacillus lutrae TaxID=2078573 RepID=A0A7X3K1G3_9BACL|nr:SidA/IucD/PvdA family monooxygenase [Paenibacillus lutrae]MVP01956.1 SidA/IucD/PvdA family monooxygenase [Paenibacillus lutrae]
MSHIYDLIGIGFGPSNIALAIALEEMDVDLDFLFLEKSANRKWQEGMLLDGSDIQNNPLRDLVTPRNPRSHYTFINYLKEVGRFFEYLNLGIHFPLRKEYALYISWVTEQFSESVKYSTQVTHVDMVAGKEGQKLWQIKTSAGEEYLCRSLIVGPGRTPNIPAEFKPHIGSSIFHLTEYIQKIESFNLQEDTTIAVIGASQSAVEILLDLMNRTSAAQICSIHRSFGFRLKDTSPFSDHVYFPEFIDYYYSLSRDSKQQIAVQLNNTNYSSADGDVINQLYLRLYEEKLDGKNRFRFINNTRTEEITKADKGWNLLTQEIHTKAFRQVQADVVILATGFLDFGVGHKGEKFPPLLERVKNALPVDEFGVIKVQRDYAVKLVGEDALPHLYLNGLCESTHGLGDAGSFSLVSLRSMEIAKSVVHNLTKSDEVKERLYQM